MTREIAVGARRGIRANALSRAGEHPAQICRAGGARAAAGARADGPPPKLEIARAVLSPRPDESSYVNGATFLVDGASPRPT
jgi:NAD(P)-dependent dehydrogenase (short-subunit alcohol dehydrogenase family)